MNSAWKRWPLQSSGHGFFGEPTAFLFLAQLAGFGHSLGDAFDEGLLGYKQWKYPMKFMWNSYLAWRYIKHQKNKRPCPSQLVQIGLPLLPVLAYRHFSTEGAIPCPPYTSPTALPRKDASGGPSFWALAEAAEAPAGGFGGLGGWWGTFSTFAGLGAETLLIRSYWTSPEKHGFVSSLLASFCWPSIHGKQLKMNKCKRSEKESWCRKENHKTTPQATQQSSSLDFQFLTVLLGAVSLWPAWEELGLETFHCLSGGSVLSFLHGSWPLLLQKPYWVGPLLSNFWQLLLQKP